MTSTLETTPAPPARTPRRARVGAVVVGLVDGLLGVALPFAVLVVLALVAWAGLGRAEAWTPYLGAAADAWLLGHGVGIRFAAPGGAFTVTVALLGPALVTALAAVRSGRRAARTASPAVAWAAALAGTAAASAAVLRLGSGGVAAPVLWQGVVLPVCLAALGSVVGMRSARTVRALPAGVRAGLAATALVVAAAGLATAAALLARFADVIALEEGLDAGPAGGLVLTIGQVLAVPTLVVWAAAWLLGPGFAVGVGSASGPFAAQVGPLPALPVLGAVPVDPPVWAGAALLVPVLAGFAVGVLARRRGASASAVPIGAVAGATAALCLGALAALASGSAGPGRFAAVGPDALLVAGSAFLLIGLPAVIGAAVTPRATPTAGEALQALR